MSPYHYDRRPPQYSVPIVDPEKFDIEMDLPVVIDGYEIWVKILYPDHREDGHQGEIAVFRMNDAGDPIEEVTELLYTSNRRAYDQCYRLTEDEYFILEAKRKAAADEAARDYWEDMKAKEHRVERTRRAYEVFEDWRDG